VTQDLGIRRIGWNDIGNRKWMILKKWVGRCGLDVSGLGEEPVAGCSEYGDEPLGSIKGGEFLD
jgi:hypothetical protein